MQSRAQDPGYLRMDPGRDGRLGWAGEPFHIIAAASLLQLASSQHQACSRRHHRPGSSATWVAPWVPMSQERANYNPAGLVGADSCV